MIFILLFGRVEIAIVEVVDNVALMCNYFWRADRPIKGRNIDEFENAEKRNREQKV